MSKYSDFMAWRVSFESKAESERDAIVSSTFPLEVSLEIQADADAGVIDQDTGAEAVAAILYADHVAAELQAENAALRAKVAELEVGREWLPIEGAPKDGSVIYVRIGSIYELACWSPDSDAKYPWLVASIYNGEVVENRMPADIEAEWIYLPQGVTK